ncbi:LysM peptidoglycan-binding domain-containing protein [Planococcus lenghuensis]|uniref:LysM domain-containing protein n=1 Tax=Planococcus lenghuensis TaxID=2213202 RepID=A0A1Q2KVZ0_9BACL|nr:LysM domain-containing protein [Planococcus lenghuensis]AQQ52284.1 hypothetical protein B0X71_03595 [Planococcus lenghuensis]
MSTRKKFTTAALATGLILGGGLSASAAEVVTVEAGDTFWGIAEEYGVGVDQLMEDNAQYDEYGLPVGAELTVNNDDDIHFVQPGDTLSQIGEDYGVTTDDLYEYNPGVDEYGLMPGDGIVYGPGEDGAFEDEVADDDEVAQTAEDEVDEDDGLIDEDDDGAVD